MDARTAHVTLSANEKQSAYAKSYQGSAGQNPSRTSSERPYSRETPKTRRHELVVLHIHPENHTMELFTTPSLIGFSACILAIYLIGLAVYRLYLSPLAKFSGPKLAALTLWYEFYYDVIKRGRYTWKISELHKQYGERSFDG